MQSANKLRLQGLVIAIVVLTVVIFSFRQTLELPPVVIIAPFDKIGDEIPTMVLPVTEENKEAIAKFVKASKPTFIPSTVRAGGKTVGEIKQDAMDWAAGSPDRYWNTTADTHSMEPYFSSHSITLCIRYTGQELVNGNVLIFNRGDAPRVMHVMVDQKGDSVYMSGVNNRQSDGWFKKSTIEGIVVGQLYLP